MKNTHQIITLIIIFSSFFACRKTKKTQANKIETKEAVSIASNFQSLTGGAIKIVDFKGKKVFLNFWATWCKPCIEEMPDIEATAKILEKENYVFLLASDEPIEKIKKFADERGFDLDFIRFSGNLEEWNIYATPTTIIFDTESQEVNRYVGVYEWQSDKILSALREIK